MIHVRKCKPEYFEALRTGAKTFELRREQPDEAAFAVGDFLALNEFASGRHSDERDKYTGNCLLFEISYVLRDAQLLGENVAALGLRPKPLSWEDVRGMLGK